MRGRQDTLSESCEQKRWSRGARVAKLPVHPRQRLALNQGQAMIVIPRKAGESVVVGDDILLTVIEVRGDRIRLGVEHLNGLPVRVGEVCEEDSQDLAVSILPQ